MTDAFTHGPVLWLAQVALLLGCFWAVYGVLRFHPWARVMLCRTVSVALLGLPLLSLAPVPALVDIPPSRKTPDTSLDLKIVPVRPTPMLEPNSSAGTRPPLDDDITNSHPDLRSRLPVITLSESLLVIWLTGGALLLVRWLFALKIGLRSARLAQEPPQWAREIQAEIASHLHLGSQVRLGVMQEAGSPLLLGPRPFILLPRHLIEEDAQDDFVPSLTHEMVHVKEGDWWWSQWLQVVTAILWVLPPAWFLRRAHDSSAEIVCDSIAASLVGGADLYASTLARQSLHALGRPRLAAVPMLRRSGIRQRVDLLLSGFTLPAFSRRAVMATGLLVLLACGGLSGIRVAAAADAPTSPASPARASGAALTAAVSPLPGHPPAQPAPKEIEPYGGISWNDGVFQVIQKIKKIEGITHITWESASTDVAPIDLIPIATPDELAAAFEKRASSYFPKGVAIPDNPYYQRSLSTYKDASGGDRKFVSDPGATGNSLTAGPIVLAGHPFTLEVLFLAYPGFAVEFPDRSINYPGAVAPLAITKVVLTTDTNLSDDAGQAIVDKLIAKYEITDPNVVRNLKNLDTMQITDRGPAELDMDLVDDRKITYNYQNRYDLVAYYQKLLTKLAEGAAKSKPDGINGL